MERVDLLVVSPQNVHIGVILKLQFFVEKGTESDVFQFTNFRYLSGSRLFQQPCSLAPSKKQLPLFSKEQEAMNGDLIILKSAI